MADRDAKRQSGASLRRKLRVHGLLLGGTFALVVGCFVASTLYTDAQLRGIAPAADVIAERAVPVIQALSSLRADVRELDTAVEDELDGHAGARERTDRAMAEAQRDLRLYLAAPHGAAEDARGANIAWAFERLLRGLDEVRATLERSGADAARAKLETGLRMHAQQMDALLAEDLDAEASGVRVAAVRVAHERGRARKVGFGLDAASLLASAVLAAIAFARIRKDERLLARMA